MYAYICVYICIYIYYYTCLYMTSKALSTNGYGTASCSALQRVAVRCSVLQCVAVCCGVLRCVALCVHMAIGSKVKRDHVRFGYVTVSCSELQ